MRTNGPYQGVLFKDAALPHENSENGIASRMLDSAAIERYERYGWVRVPGFFSAGETDDLVRFTEETRALPEISGAQMIYRETSLLDPGTRVVQRIEDFCTHHEGFDRLIRAGRLLRCIEELLDVPAVLFKDKINFKEPGGGGFEAHQDQQAGWSAYAPLFVTAMVSIDPSTMGNGCLQLGNGPRLTGLVGGEWAPLTREEMTNLDLVPVPTRAGDVIFFDSYVAHASGPNLSADPRRVLYLTFNRASDGDHRSRYYADKRASFPPDVDRKPGIEYRFRV